jgi:hypothetical protein
MRKWILETHLSIGSKKTKLKTSKLIVVLAHLKDRERMIKK